MRPVRYYDLAVKLMACLCIGSIAMALLMVGSLLPAFL